MNPKRIQLATALALAAAHAVAGGCRPCARVAAQWEGRLTEELAYVGTGGVADTGLTDHLRVTLSSGALELMAAALAQTEVFRPASRTVSVSSDDGPAVVVAGEMTGRLASLDVAPGQNGDARAILGVSGIIAFQLEVPGRRTRLLTTEGTAQISAPLVFVRGDSGPVLSVDLRRASITQSSAALASTPDDFAALPVGVLEKLTYQLFTGLVVGVDRDTPLARWTILTPSGAPIALEPSSLYVDSGGRVLRLGVVTSLRPGGVLGDAVIGGCSEAMGSDCIAREDSEALFQVEVHPDLWRAALVYGHATGRTARRFASDGLAAVDAPIVVAVDSAFVDGESVTVNYTTYCLADGCGRRHTERTGLVEIVAGSPRVSLSPSTEATPVDDSFAPLAVTLLEGMLGAGRFVLADGSILELDALEMLGEGDGIVVTGDVRRTLDVERFDQTGR